MKENKIKDNDNNKCYTVYMHTSPSGKRYIGITSLPVEKRWQKGKGYQNQVFYRAVQKYGFDNIEHKILYEGLTKDEAEQKEIELIAYYNTTDCRCGYNVDTGGNSIGKHSEETKRKISEASKNISDETRRKMSKSRKGKHHTEETKQKIREKNLGLTKKPHSEETKRKMSEQRKGENNGMYGRTHTDEVKSRLRELNSIPVKQYSLKGEFIAEYRSITEAGNAVSGNPNNIAYCCKNNQKTSSGYIWRYANDVLTQEHINWCNFREPSLNVRVNGFSVSQYKRNGEFVKEYRSVKEASRSTGIIDSNISSCCKRSTKTAGGYIWRYTDDMLTDLDLDWCNKHEHPSARKQVGQYTEEGELLEIYDSIAIASKITGIDASSISKCCKGKIKKAKGYVWVYADDKNNERRKAI